MLKGRLRKKNEFELLRVSRHQKSGEALVAGTSLPLEEAVDLDWQTVKVIVEEIASVIVVLEEVKIEREEWVVSEEVEVVLV